MLLDRLEAVLVRFSGTTQGRCTLGDLVHAIPLRTIRQRLVTVEKESQEQHFQWPHVGDRRFCLPDLKCEQAFEFSDASAGRSAEEPLIKILVPDFKYHLAELMHLQNALLRNHSFST